MTVKRGIPARKIGRARKPLSPLFGVVLSLFVPVHCSAQRSGDLTDLRKRVETLEGEQKDILKRLETIQGLLAARSDPIPSRLELGPADMPSFGEKTAKVTLVEYFDYQCPFCARFFENTMPQLRTNYIATGKLRYLARDFPLEEAHPFALLASESARCANEQGKFWPMYYELLGNSDALDRKSISIYVHDVGLDDPAFDKCLDSGRYAAEIRAGESDAAKIGVQGTPTFFLGVADHDGKAISHVERFDGAVDYATLKKAIDHLLTEQE